VKGIARVRQHVRANVIGYVALFVALGSTGAWAADKITSHDIARNAVHAKHIKAASVKTRKIADDAVTNGKLGSKSKSRWVVATNAGDIVRSKGVVSSTMIDPAVYQVTFDRDVSECAWSATVARNVAAAPEPGEIGVRPPDTDPNSVIVHMFDSAGAPAMNRFHLIVVC